MFRFAMTKLVTAILAICLPVVTMAQEGTMLFVASDDPRVHQDISERSIGFQAPVINTDGSFNALSDTMQSAQGPTVILQTIDGLPSESDFQSTLDAIDQIGAPVTYILFVDGTDDIDWVSSFNYPNNMRLALSLRPLDEISVAEIYEANGIDYDPANLSYNYSNAAFLALQQLAPPEGRFEGVTVETWSPGRAAMFLDSGVIQSGADPSSAAEVTRIIREGPSLDTIDLSSLPGVSNPDFEFGVIDDDMDAVRAATLLGECSGPVPWDGYIENDLSFMAFGGFSR